MCLHLHWLALLMLWQDTLIDQMLFIDVIMTKYGIQCHAIIVI